MKKLSNVKIAKLAFMSFCALILGCVFDISTAVGILAAIAIILIAVDDALCWFTVYILGHVDEMLELKLRLARVKKDD